jgi:Tfp pilus assembly protein PilF
VELDPRSAQSHYSLGLAYLKSGERPKAREQLKRLMAIDRDAGENLRKEIEKE